MKKLGAEEIVRQLAAIPIPHLCNEFEQCGACGGLKRRHIKGCVLMAARDWVASNPRMMIGKIGEHPWGPKCDAKGSDCKPIAEDPA